MFIVKNRALGVLAALMLAAGFVVFSALFDALSDPPVQQQGEGTLDRQADTVTTPNLPTAGPVLRAATSGSNAQFAGARAATPRTMNLL